MFLCYLFIGTEHIPIIGAVFEDIEVAHQLISENFSRTAKPPETIPQLIVNYFFPFKANNFSSNNQKSIQFNQPESTFFTGQHHQRHQDSIKTVNPANCHGSNIHIFFIVLFCRIVLFSFHFFSFYSSSKSI